MIKQLFYKPPVEYHKKPCTICGKMVEVDQFNQGDCNNCGWYNSPFDTPEQFVKQFPDMYLMNVDNKDIVIFPNCVSQNKAKKLYAEGKPFRPSLEDFLDMLYFYCEVSFQYGQLDCELSFEGDTIVFGWSPESVTYYKDQQDFIDNAKIGNEYVRNIWDKVEDPRYL